MRTPAAAPYLQPPEDCVDAGPWTGGLGAPLQAVLEHWDPFTVTDLSRVVTVDTDAVRDACRLGPDATLAVSVSWWSSTTRLSGGPPPTELGDLAGLLRVDLSQSLPGHRIGGRVDLRTRLVLRHPGRRPSPISPTAAGTVLWRDQDSVVVEGSAARFPVTALDFTQTVFSDGAAWALEWDADNLARPLLGGLRLLLNTAHPQLTEALGSPGEPRTTALQSFITFDIARTLVHGALSNDDFTAAPHSYDEGTVGRAAADLIGSCWHHIPVSSLAQRLRDNPARIDTDLQAHLGLLTTGGGIL